LAISSQAPLVIFQMSNKSNGKKYSIESSWKMMLKNREEIGWVCRAKFFFFSKEKLERETGVEPGSHLGNNPTLFH